MLEKRGLEEIGDNKLENESTGKLMFTVKQHKGRIRTEILNSFGFGIEFPSMKILISQKINHGFKRGKRNPLVEKKKRKKKEAQNGMWVLIK